MIFPLSDVITEVSLNVLFICFTLIVSFFTIDFIFGRIVEIIKIWRSKHES